MTDALLSLATVLGSAAAGFVAHTVVSLMPDPDDDDE